MYVIIEQVWRSTCVVYRTGHLEVIIAIPKARQAAKIKAARCIVGSLPPGLTSGAGGVVPCLLSSYGKHVVDLADYICEVWDGWLGPSVAILVLYAICSASRHEDAICIWHSWHALIGATNTNNARMALIPYLRVRRVLEIRLVRS